jgi:hypothetical protein
MKYWEIIADNLSKAGLSWGCVSIRGGCREKIKICITFSDEFGVGVI